MGTLWLLSPILKSNAHTKCDIHASETVFFNPITKCGALNRNNGLARRIRSLLWMMMQHWRFPSSFPRTTKKNGFPRCLTSVLPT